MKKSTWRSVVLTIALTLSLPWIAFGQEVIIESMAGNDEYPVREDMALVTMDATVVDIDYESREVTLEGPGGNVFTVTADPRVERLDEVESGDVVSVGYLTSLAFELREPTAEELETPLVILDDVAVVPEDIDPAAGAIRMIRAVCTIEGLDRQTMTAKLLGPLGGYNVVNVADPKNLPKMRIGDTVVVTYTEAVAITLVKAEEIEEEMEEEIEEEIEEEMEEEEMEEEMEEEAAAG
jgi:hypothetical protein